MERFEKARAQKKKELFAVLSFLAGQKEFKSHKSILMGAKSCEYFRGVNFHLAVLSHAEHIMKLIPSFVEANEIV